MVKPFLVLLFIVSPSSLIAGCTSSYTISDTPDSLSLSYNELGKRLNVRKAIITLKNGEGLEAFNPSLSISSTQFTNPVDSSSRFVPLSEVARIDVRNKNKGTLEGLKYGAIVGGGAAAALLIAGSSTGAKLNPEAFLILPAGAALFGGFIGTMVGNTIGYKEVYSLGKNEREVPVSGVILFDSKKDAHHVIVEIAGFPLNQGIETGTWEPTASIRAGYRWNLTGPIDMAVFAEYHEFHFDPHWGLSSSTFSDGHRRDYALYVEAVGFEFLELALGGYYTIQDEVVYDERLSTPPRRRVDPEVSAFRFYYHVGVTSAIHLYGPVSIPFGLVYRDQDQEGGAIGFRTGVLISF